jgi:formylglycine-generating enzyme required for sulfatase activity
MDKKRLTELLLECPSLRDKDTRGSLLKMLPHHIVDCIKVGNSIIEYAVNIVDACMNYSDGLKHLFEAVRFFDDKTEPFQKLSDFWANQNLQPESPSPDILAQVETIIMAQMAQLNLSSKINARDEFTQHNQDSLEQIREAMILLKQLPSQTPEYSRVSLCVGSALTSTGELLQAARLFIQVIENTDKKSERATAHFNLFQVQLRRKAYSEALKNLQAAITIEPHYALHDLHKYPIEQLLGTGGMGCVFLCQNKNPFIQYARVVVKCFWENPKGTLKEVFKEPFAMRDIAGDYVPEPVDFGYVDLIKQKRAYFVTAYIDGAIDGEAWLEKYGPMNLETGLQVGLQIAKGLQVAHNAGICHLDLKPANILLLKKTSEVLETSEVSISVKIIDFGLSQVIPSLRQKAMTIQRQTGFTQFGQAIFGTLDYACPEQLGFSQYGKPGVQCDVFAFGTTMYRFFTGRNPRFFRERDLPNVLRELLGDCVDEEPKCRPESVQQLIEQFEKIQGIEPRKPNEYEEIQHGKRSESTQQLIEQFEKIQRVEPRKPFENEEIQHGKRFQFEIVTVNNKGAIIHREQKQASCQTEYLGKGVTLEMVSIPSGTFTMGSTEYDNEKPTHSVTVQPFFMAKYPVTQAQWKAIMGNNPSYFKGENRPVEQVSWNDAVEFCQRLSEKTGKTYRLPNEAEWEYTCRAGTTTPFYFGETITTDLVNYRGDSYASGPEGVYRKETTDVGIFPPNAFGLYDMHGNVWEWCADPLHDNYEGAPSDGSIWGKEKKGLLAKWFSNDDNKSLFVLRGGSWGDSAWWTRSSFRNRNSRSDRGTGCGFRPVRLL